jgi:hypothetical protein
MRFKGAIGRLAIVGGTALVAGAFAVPSQAATSSPASTSRPSAADASRIRVTPAATSYTFYTLGDVSEVIGAVSISGKSFTGTDVTLYDTSCDNRSAEFWFETNHGSYPHHKLSTGCNTDGTWNSLTGTDSANISWVRVNTRACNSTGCSSTYYGAKMTP